MKSYLYVYDIEKLKKMREEMSDFDFNSIAYYLNRFEDSNDLIDIFEKKKIFDKTNLNKYKNNDINNIKIYLIKLNANKNNNIFNFKNSLINYFKIEVPLFFKKN